MKEQDRENPSSEEVLLEIRKQEKRWRRLLFRGWAILWFNAGLVLIGTANFWSSDYEIVTGLLTLLNLACCVVLAVLQRKTKRLLEATATLRQCVESIIDMGDRLFTPEGKVYGQFLLEQADAAYKVITGGPLGCLFTDERTDDE